MQEVYNIGTSVFFRGDECNRPGYGVITDEEINYLGEQAYILEMDDGRYIPDVTARDFEPHCVLGNFSDPEFSVVDEIDGYDEEETFQYYSY